MIYNTHLVTHVAAGVLAVGGVAVAIFPKVAEKSHQWHGIGRRTFFYGMLLVFLTVLPLTYSHPNLFLFLIGIFSFYMAFTGWHFAVDRKGIAWFLPTVLITPVMIWMHRRLYKPKTSK